MKEKKNLIVIIAVVALLLLFGAYFLFRADLDYTEEEEDVRQAKVSLLTEPHLFLAGTDGTPGPRNEGEAVTQFNPGDLLGLSGRYEVEEQTFLQLDLVDEEGNIIDRGFISPSRIRNDGGHSMCCAQVPDSPGEYNLRLFVEGITIHNLTFEVLD